MKKLSVRVIAVLAALVLIMLSACGTGDNEGDPAKASDATEAPATQGPASATAPAATGEPAVTDVPEPTDIPVTREPKKTPEALDPGTDQYFDFSEYGEAVLVPDPNESAGLENYEQGMMVFPQGFDPYVWVLLDEPVPAADYRYVALRVLAGKNDKSGQLRFATTTDDRGWALLNYNYKTPGSWETIVFDLASAAMLNEDTMDGDITRLRIDPYNDEFDDENLSDDYTLIVESAALFTDPEKAQAYAGLYTWPEDADKTPLPPTETPDDGPTPAPTHRPTERPDGAPEFNAIGTDYYFDFTQYGADEMTAGNGILIEQEKEGVLLTPDAWDPYVWITLDPKISASEFRYFALKVKANAGDRPGQLRYVTTSDSRGWAMVPITYSHPGEWEIIVLDLSAAEYMIPETLNGDLIRLRLDPYDDETDPQTQTLGEAYTVIVESIAMFNDKAAADAYAGLYKWSN